MPSFQFQLSSLSCKASLAGYPGIHQWNTQETGSERGKAGKAAMFVINQLYLAFAPGATWKKNYGLFYQRAYYCTLVRLFTTYIYIYRERDREKLTVFAHYNIEWGTKKKLLQDKWVGHSPAHFSQSTWGYLSKKSSEPYRLSLWSTVVSFFSLKQEQKRNSQSGKRFPGSKSKGCGILEPYEKRGISVQETKHNTDYSKRSSTGVVK